MEISNYQLAEMVNSANYAAMSYAELVTLDFAFHLAIGEIKPLVEKKRAEELAVHTHEFAAKINCYCVTKAEVLECLEKETFNDVSVFSMSIQDVDDQNANDYDSDTSCDSRGVEVPLALPEHIEEEETVVEVSADVDDMAAEKESGTEDTAVPETNELSLVDEAMSVLRALPVPKCVNDSAPYYVECDFCYGDDGDLGHSNPRWRNMGKKDLEGFRSATETFIRLFKKKNVIASTDDCLAYNDSLNTYIVRMYHIPEDAGNVIDAPAQEITLTADEMKALKKKKSYLKKAIKLAKEYSFSDGTDVHTPFFDRYVFRRQSKNLDIKSDRIREYEDADSLMELMPAFESYAKLFHEGYEVMSKDNCVAAMQYDTIYVVIFNIPTQEKKRRTSKKTNPAAKDVTTTEELAAVTNSSTTQPVDDLVLKAVDMTRNLPLTNGTDANNTYYLQSSFSVTNEGALIYSGKPFSSNVSLDDLDRCRRQHEKYARTMKASRVVSTDGYTAFISNDGKGITVFNYNIQGVNQTNQPIG